MPLKILLAMICMALVPAVVGRRNSMQPRPYTPLHTAPSGLHMGASSAAHASWSVSVFDYGAVGDGVTDDTQAFQKALDFVASNNGGVVLAPPAQYKFDGSLTITNATTLEGSYAAAPPSHSHKPDTTGTVFLVYGGRGNEDGTPFVTLYASCTLRGVSIMYPEQVGNAAPVPYPWTVDMKSKQDNAAFTDSEVLNPYNAIRGACPNIRPQSTKLLGDSICRLDLCCILTIDVSCHSPNFSTTNTLFRPPFVRSFVRPYSRGCGASLHCACPRTAYQHGYLHRPNV
jgi:hypothetical protein